MHRLILCIVLLACSASAWALESIRIGNQVLSVGDSAARVMALMGKPVVHARGAANKGTRKKPKPAGKGKRATAKEQGEQWQYRRDGHTTIFTILDGKVAHIEDTAR